MTRSIDNVDFDILVGNGTFLLGWLYHALAQDHGCPLKALQPLRDRKGLRFNYILSTKVVLPHDVRDDGYVSIYSIFIIIGTKIDHHPLYPHERYTPLKWRCKQ